MVREIIDTSGKTSSVVRKPNAGVKLGVATVIFAALLYGFWMEVQSTGLVATLGGHIGSAFASFALMLAVLWFSCFGAMEWVASSLWSPTARVFAPALLAIPYVVFSVPRGEFQWIYALGLAALPLALAALLEFTHPEPQKFTWQDGVTLVTIAAVLEARVFSGAWPYNGLGSLPKLYLADVVLYLYLVVRRLQGVGFSFVPQAIDFGIGVREWLFFLPFALGLGFATHFIGFYPRHPSIGQVAGALLVTFLLTAMPEELFFRGILQNLLEPRLGRTWSLIVASCLFGLSHFHKSGMRVPGITPVLFNWRYVMIAAIAGVFYGRAWRARRRLFASSLTHTLVDVVWGLWFR